MVPPPRTVPRPLLPLAAAAALLVACTGRSPAVADAGPPGPSLAFVALPASMGCDVDADPDADGIQVDVTVALQDDDDSGFSQVLVTNAQNGATASGVLADGSATVRVDVVPGASPAVDNALTATSSNPAGDVLEVGAVVAVDCLLPPAIVSCVFTAPAPNAVIAADNVDVAVTCTSSGLSAAQRAMMAGARLRIDAVAASDGAIRSQELDLVEGAAAGNVLLPGSGSHTLSATLLDPDGLFDPDPNVTVDVDVQP